MSKSLITIEEETIKDENDKLFIRRIIFLNNKKIYDCTCSIQAYNKEKSPLKYFSYWLNDYVSLNDFSQAKERNDIACNRAYFISFFNKIRSKFFRKCF